MTSHDQHLTIEQLSDILDNQLHDEEQEEVQAHLLSCAYCQQELAELKTTVNLLHALPQPALPRSFTLPLTITRDAPPAITPHRKSAQTTQKAALSASSLRGEEEEQTGGKTGEAQVIRLRKAKRARKALQSLGALAAVAGFLLIFSGLFTTLPFLAKSTTNGGVTSQSKQTGVGHNGNLVTPMVEGASNQQSATPEAGQTASPGAIQPSQANGQHPSVTTKPGTTNQTQTTSSPSWLAIFDLSVPVSRIGMGTVFLLVAIGCLIYLLRHPTRAGPAKRI